MIRCVSLVEEEAHSTCAALGRSSSMVESFGYHATPQGDKAGELREPRQQQGIYRSVGAEPCKQHAKVVLSQFHSFVKESTGQNKQERVILSQGDKVHRLQPHQLPLRDISALPSVIFKEAPIKISLEPVFDESSAEDGTSLKQKERENLLNGMILGG
eukprot:409082-Hanusia_phi.AAC.2